MIRHHAKVVLSGVAAALLGLGAAKIVYKGVIAPPEIQSTMPIVIGPEQQAPMASLVLAPAQELPQALPVVPQPTTPEPTPEPPKLQPNPLAARYIERGNMLMQLHDLPAARNFYELAFNAGELSAAVLLWQSYDPTFLTDPNDRMQANAAKAREWRERAEALTSPAVR